MSHVEITSKPRRATRICFSKQSEINVCIGTFLNTLKSVFALLTTDAFKKIAYTHTHTKIIMKLHTYMTY